MKKPAHFVRVFKARFADLVESGEKPHTVRPEPKRMPQPGDTISLRTWTGRPYRSKQRILREATITKVERILIEDSEAGVFQPWGRVTIDGRRLTPREIRAFSEADGFAHPVEFLEFFIKQPGDEFAGIVIHWA